MEMPSLNLKSRRANRELMAMAFAPFLESPWLTKLPSSSAKSMTFRSMPDPWIAKQAARILAKLLMVDLKCNRALRAMQSTRTLAEDLLKRVKGITICSTSRSFWQSSGALCSRSFLASSCVGIASKICSKSSLLMRSSSHRKLLKTCTRSVVLVGMRFKTMAIFRAR